MITCKELAQQVKDNVKKQVAEMATKPSLAIVTVGDDPASASYVKGKIKDCHEVGIVPHHVKLAEDITQEELNDMMWSLRLHTGIILQLPIPKHLDADKALEMINIYQDVDGLKPGSKHIPCTARGVFEWLKANDLVAGKHIVIINRSKLVGRPLAKLLLDADATVTVCHSKTNELHKILYDTDVVVMAVGKPNFINSNDVLMGTVVVDVGINKVDGKLCGDYGNSILDEAYNIYVTPVPGGVGLLTRAYLLQNVVEYTW